MGQSILQTKFNNIDFKEFAHRLEQETCLLQEWCKAGILNVNSEESGFELESWLLNADYQPASNNLNFIKRSGNNLLISEAVQSCLEFNMPHDTVHEEALTRHSERLKNIIRICNQQAKTSNQHIILIGTLPNATQKDYNELKLTSENRYFAMNNRLAKLRNYHPLYLHIEGNDVLDMPMNSFSLAGAIASFQIHFRVPFAKSARLYNASLVLSAPMVALSGNSPFLFGRCLWEESRIPFYEQILRTELKLDKLPRVFFGTGYIKDSLIDLFIENNLNYTPFLPQVMDVSEESLPHLRLHNGTIYRWNRPVIDFDAHHTPHFRVEHRPISAGPTVIDMIANAAFYYGITYYFINVNKPIEEEIPFESAKNNFYYAAKYGLKTQIYWLKNKKIGMTELILQTLLPLAKEGLKQLEINAVDIDYYLSIIAERVSKNKTGSQWQKDFFVKNQHDFNLLVKTYIELQESGIPVHNWRTE